MSDWGEFYERTKDQPPQPLLVRAVPYVREKVAALDLGSGALTDSAFLLAAGFKTVTAVDHEPIAKKRADELSADRFQYVISKFEHFSFRERQFDLVNAQYSLPFIGRPEFGTIWSRIHACLKPDGVLPDSYSGTGTAGAEICEWRSIQGRRPKPFFPYLMSVNFKSKRKTACRQSAQ